MKRSILVPVVSSLFLLTLPVLWSACSVFSPKEPNPEVKATVLAVADKYLQYVITGREKQLNSFVLWGDLLKKGSEQALTRDEFRKQLNSLQGRWTVEEHPLLGLKVVDLEIDGNDALVTLIKAGRDNYPTIWVKLFWSGSAWHVVDDSLFGKDKLIEQLNRQEITF